MVAVSEQALVAKVLDLVRERGIEFVDLKLTDVPGAWQHITIPASELEAATFARGIAFDGSSIRGFRGIEESDMVIMPDPGSAFVDPFMVRPTLSLICDVYEPGLERYDRDPRHIAQRAEEYLRQTGIADTALFGPEPEFFIFDEVRYESSQRGAFYQVDSAEAHWNSGRDEGPNLGYKIRGKQGYFPVAPTDQQTDIRSEMVAVMQQCGLTVERHHHEVGAPGQAEINFRATTLTRCGDAVEIFKYVVKNVARRYGKTATFMPKPVFGDNGSGMHVHQSLGKDGVNLFHDPERYGGLSRLGLYYVGGILRHAPALLALTNPTTNSYKRLVPGYEAPVNLAFAKGNRSAAVRVPISAITPKTARIEFRTPDATANPYLAFAAMMMAGLDGVLNEIDPVREGYGPLDYNIYRLSPEERRKVKSVPGSLEEAFAALAADHDFLLQGGVFDEEFLANWAELKREESDLVRLRPHPMEFELFYDA
ncbi:MAG: type I glutamate--ammonia ligase [Symbiobacteriia bacterium]